MGGMGGGHRSVELPEPHTTLAGGAGGRERGGGERGGSHGDIWNTMHDADSTGGAAPGVGGGAGAGRMERLRRPAPSMLNGVMNIMGDREGANGHPEWAEE